MARKLVFMKTHKIEPYVIIEYEKLRRSLNMFDDCWLFIDNSTEIIPPDNDIPTKIVGFNDVDLKCFFYNEYVHKQSNLPYFTDNKENNDCSKLLWYNGDYPFYYMRNYFPNFDYYWCTEYDVFCNGKSYKPFFNQFKKDNSDFIAAEYKVTELAPDTLYDSEWVYGKDTHYQSFFPVIRLSGRAIDFLYRRRLEEGKFFEQIKSDPNVKWIYCEIFAPTELTRAGFKCKSLDTEHLRFSPDYNLSKERIFEHPDNKLYHPVR